MLRVVICFMAFLAALGLALEAPIPGYTVEILTWEIDAFANGTTYNLTGSIEQVYDQLDKINPDFRRNATNSTGFESEPAATVTPGWNWLCGHIQGWGDAKLNIIKEGIAYLHGVSGSKPHSGPGPSACARVSCSWSSAIWWCNDNKKDITLSSFNVLADCAQILVDYCIDDTDYVVGQNFNPDNWNCIVRYDNDDC